MLICAVAILLFLEVYSEKIQDWVGPEKEGMEQELTASRLERFNRHIDARLQSLFSEYKVGPDNVRTESRSEDLRGASFVFKRIEARVLDPGMSGALKRELDSLVGMVPDGDLLIRKEISKEGERTTFTVRMEERAVRQVVLVSAAGAFAKKPVPQKRARVAIIVDDIGQSMRPVKELLSMDVAFTFSILPGLENSVEAAKMIHGRQREIMLHLPMEPLNHADAVSTGSLLTIRMDREAIRANVLERLNQVPHLAGVNNHMGSRFTQDRQRMAVVLEEVGKKGLYFVDSVTIGTSVAFEESRRLGLTTGKRDIFLDHVDRHQAVTIQIKRLIQLALSEGSAIAICHPRKATIKALREAIHQFRSAGVEIVPASEVIGTS